MNKSADIVIIGAGGGGAVAAKELGEKGYKVIVLEAGPWYGNSKWPKPNAEEGAISSGSYEDLSIELLHREFTDLEDDMNSLITGKFRWGPASSQASPWPRQIRNGGFTWQNSGVGGSTLHYLANSPRAFPQAVDNVWPISYQELIPYYEKVETILPVSPAFPSAKENLFYYGAEQENWERIETKDVTSPGYRPQPNAILHHGEAFPGSDSRDYGNYGCTYRGHCINGCHIGTAVESVAKRSTFASYIPLALKTGNVELLPNSFAVKVLTKRESGGEVRATGVTYRNTWSGETGEISADITVMAAGPIETPRLWLNSGLPENPWVGKGLVNHWFDSVTGIFEEDIIQENIGESFVNPFVGQNAAARFDYPGLGAMETFGSSPGIYTSLMYATSGSGFYFQNQRTENAPWDMEGAVVGKMLKEFMMDYRRSLSIVTFTDDQVSQLNGVTLDFAHKDENGYIPRISYQTNESDLTKRDNLAVIAAGILRSAGAKTVLRANWSPDIYIHIMSTMRIGFVTDSDCEAKQVKRLFIADNSVLYNSLGGVNPTLTTQALATRTADKIADKYME